MNNISQSIISRISQTTHQWVGALPNKIILFAVAVIALVAAAFIALRQYLPHTLRNHSAVPYPPSTPSIVPINTSPSLPPSTTENALSPDNVRAEAIKYGAKNATIAWTNQSKEGFRAGCTRNSLGFLASGKEFDYSPESLTDFITKGSERDILPPDDQGNYGMDDPSELLFSDNPFNLDLVDKDGTTTFLPIQVNLDVKGAEHDTLTESIQSLIQSKDNIIGFTISAGTETFAVKFRSNGDVEFFDPHGDSTQQEPSFIFTYDEDKAADNISQLVLDRCLATIQLGVAGGGVNLCPCAAK